MNLVLSGSERATDNTGQHKRLEFTPRAARLSDLSTERVAPESTQLPIQPTTSSEPPPSTTTDRGQMRNTVQTPKRGSPEGQGAISCRRTQDQRIERIAGQNRGRDSYAQAVCIHRRRTVSPLSFGRSLIPRKEDEPQGARFILIGREKCLTLFAPMSCWPHTALATTGEAK